MSLNVSKMSPKCLQNISKCLQNISKISPNVSTNGWLHQSQMPNETSSLYIEKKIHPFWYVVLSYYVQLMAKKFTLFSFVHSDLWCTWECIFAPAGSWIFFLKKQQCFSLANFSAKIFPVQITFFFRVEYI